MRDFDQDLVEEIFLDAVEQPASGRDEFLRAACGGNSELRHAVEQLLAADEAAGGAEFLESALLGKPNAKLKPPINLGDANDEGDVSPDRARFQILGTHREGGLGEVLIAYDRQLKRDVAIKQIKPRWQDHDEARQRFVQEAEVTGQLEHPGVVPVYAMGTWDDGRQYYAMRFIQGNTLSEVIKQYHDSAGKTDERDRVLEMRQILNRFIDVCNTIHYAHNHEILHRDIKPSNIMVGPYGETLVVDWGLAKLLSGPIDDSLTAGLLKDQPSDGSSTPTQVGGRVGTPQYMSPEQARGLMDEIGVRTDIYLLGATLYHILTGQAPHDGDTVSRLMDGIISDEWTLPRLVNPAVSPALEAICMKAMAAKPSQRYASSDQLAADLERWLADEPISVHRDSVSVRFGRWVRRHRAAAYSAAFAAVLLTIGTVGGSLLWNYQRSQQMAIQRQKQAKELQLQATRQQRLTELSGAVAAASTLAETELHADRFSSALNILDGAIDSIEGEPSLAQNYVQLNQRAAQLRQIVDFYQHADITHEHNLLSRDAKAIISCLAGLRTLGVLEKEDWWFHLPDQDLSAAQHDQLRWDIYKQLLSLDAIFVKTIGTKLSGSDRPGTVAGLLPAMRRFLRTDIGKREARAALLISDRAEMFRRSESVRWFRSIADFRLGQGRRLRGNELGKTFNAGDAHSLGVLSLIAALEESFQIFFSEYDGDDSLVAARNLFSRSSQLRPNFYWAQLSLAQAEYLLALRDPDPSWRKFDSGIHAAGRCIAMEPEKCFAYADRSSMYRSAADLVAESSDLPVEKREQLATELRQWSLADAQNADRLGANQPWIGWQHGLALFDSGQIERTVTRFMKASKLTYPLIELEDATLLRVDDLRGRSEAADLVARMADSTPENPIYHTLLASIKLNQNRVEEAVEAVELALKTSDPPAHAFAVRGMARLRNGEFELATQNFRATIKLSPDHDWAAFGLAACDEALGRYEQALAGFRLGQSVAKTDEHRAACLLGQSRQLARLADYEQALNRIDTVRRLEPAADIVSAVVRPLAKDYGRMRDQDPQGEATLSLKSFLQSLAKLSRATRIELSQDETAQPYRAALLNGGFELGNSTYWNHTSGAWWFNENGYDSMAMISDTDSHTGRFSMYVRGGKSESNARSARTGQDFPVRRRGSMQVSLWVKAEALQEDSLRLETKGGHTVLTVPAGTYDWRKLRGKVPLDDGAVEGREIQPMRLEIVSAGRGEVWVDDLEILCDPR